MPTPKKPRHFGSIRKLPSGRYQASYLDNNGERVNAPFTFAKKGDASDWLATIEADQVRGILRKPKGTTRTLAVYAYEWMENRPKPLKLNSWNHYDEILRHHILPTLGKLMLGDIDSETVRTGTATTVGANSYLKLTRVV
jgi:hypothetical protein